MIQHFHDMQVVVVGSAVLGGVLLGAAGAVVGGFLDKIISVYFS